MVRRFLVTSLVLALLAAGSPAGAQTRVQVVTTTQDLAAIARAVGGERVEVTAIARGDQDPHFVESKPSFILAASRADLLVHVGLDLEAAWLPNVITGARNRRIQPGAPGNVDASRGVRLQEVPTGRITRDLGDIHAYGNPHYWLDPANGRVIADNVLAGLAGVDPEGADGYRRRHAEFVSRLERKIEGWNARMAPWRGLRVVAYHNTWPYFARAFGIVVDEFLEPKPGIPPSPSHIASVIELMRREGTELILMEPWFSRKVPDLVASKTGGRVVELLPSVGGVEGVDTYVDLFEENLDRLVAAAEAAGVGPGTARGR